ncbi:MAG: LON peptidase substrate-binding domain-containing protein [Pseudomonadota bacterium]
MDENPPDILIPQDDINPGNVPAPVRDLYPERLLILPVLSRPYFPVQTMPVVLDEKPWIETIERVGKTPQHLVGLLWAEEHESDIPTVGELSRTGSIVRLHQPQRVEGKVQFIAEGLDRFQIEDWVGGKPPLVATVSYPQPLAEDEDQKRAYALAIINKIKELLPLNPLYKESLKGFLERFTPEDASPLADFAAALTSAQAPELQQVLDQVPLLPRMEKVLALLQREVEVAGLQTEIQKRVEQRMGEQQREFFLRQQLKEIQKELGIQKDDKTVESERFTNRLEELNVPAHAQARIDDELEKFSYLEPGSPEYGVTRNYLDTLTDLPWGKVSADHLDLEGAREILERDHE